MGAVCESTTTERSSSRATAPWRRPGRRRSARRPRRAGCPLTPRLRREHATAKWFGAGFPRRRGVPNVDGGDSVPHAPASAAVTPAQTRSHHLRRERHDAVSRGLAAARNVRCDAVAATLRWQVTRTAARPAAAERLRRSLAPAAGHRVGVKVAATPRLAVSRADDPRARAARSRGTRRRKRRSSTTGPRTPSPSTRSDARDWLVVSQGSRAEPRRGRAQPEARKLLDTSHTRVSAVLCGCGGRTTARPARGWKVASNRTPRAAQARTVYGGPEPTESLVGAVESSAWTLLLGRSSGLPFVDSGRRLARGSNRPRFRPDGSYALNAPQDPFTTGLIHDI